jgi:outer membrane lipopolysaccharide assembly protein LptE/RlpB
MSIYRFKGNESEMEVMSSATAKVVQKAKKDSIVKFSVQLPKSRIKMMERAIGKHSTNAELLSEFLKQVSKL